MAQREIGRDDCGDPECLANAVAWRWQRLFCRDWLLAGLGEPPARQVTNLGSCGQIDFCRCGCGDDSRHLVANARPGEGTAHCLFDVGEGDEQPAHSRQSQWSRVRTAEQGEGLPESQTDDRHAALSCVHLAEMLAEQLRTTIQISGPWRVVPVDRPRRQGSHVDGHAAGIYDAPDSRAAGRCEHVLGSDQIDPHLLVIVGLPRFTFESIITGDCQMHDHVDSGYHALHGIVVQEVRRDYAGMCRGNLGHVCQDQVEIVRQSVDDPTGEVSGCASDQDFGPSC